MPKMSKHDKQKVSVDSKKKQAIVRQYRKLTRNKNSNFPDHKGENKINNETNKQTEKPRGSTVFQRAMQEYERKQSEKRTKEEAKEEILRERNEALKRYKEKRRETYKKISQKTKWGQPVMNPRIELLLEKIQKNFENK